LTIFAAAVVMAALQTATPVHEDVLYRAEPLAAAAIPAPTAGETLAQVMFRERADAVVAVISEDGHGTGAVIREDGHVLTCAHVLGSAAQPNAQGVQVVFQGGQAMDARVLAVDSIADLALLKVETGRKLPWVPIGDLSNLQVGDPVVAIGHPKGFGWTVNQGIVSNLFVFRDGKKDPSIIQTQVPLNPGNSGGPLFDRFGRLIGVVAQGDPTAQSLNWCISIRAVKKFLLANATVLPPATLAIEAAPGATISVNGREVGKGPRALANVTAGAHVVMVQKAGLGTVQAPVVILQRSAAEITVRLAKAGTLAVSADAEGVAVYVDGVLRGTAPLSVDIAEGRHEVSGVKSGSSNSHAAVVVTAEEETEVSLSHPPSVAYLTVASAPEGAEVIVDGEPIGVTPVLDHVVSPGRHIVDVRLDGSRPRRMVVDLGPDVKRRLDFALENEFAPPTVAVAPPSAEPQVSLTRTTSRRFEQRTAVKVAAAGLAVTAVSAIVLVTQKDPQARTAAAASMIAGSAGFAIGPMLVLRPGGDDAAVGAGVGGRF